MNEIYPSQERFCRVFDEPYTYRILSYIYNGWWVIQVLDGSMTGKVYKWHESSIIKDKVYE